MAATVITVGGRLFDNSVSDAKLRDSIALSVIGRAVNSSGDPGDIAAANDGDVLRRSGTTLGFGAIPASSVTGLTADLSARPTGSGTANKVVKWTSSTALGDSSITDDGSTVTVGVSSDFARGAAVTGTAIFRGTTHNSHFNFPTTGAVEETFIRGGKTGSSVLINDSHNGNVSIAAGGGVVGVGTNTPRGVLSVLTTNPGSGFTITAWDAKYMTVGPNVASTTGAALGFSYSTTNDAANIVAAAPGVAWKPIRIACAGIDFNATNSVRAGGFSSTGLFDVGGTNSGYTVNIQAATGIGCLRIKANTTSDYAALDIADTSGSTVCAFAYGNSAVGDTKLRSRQYIWRNTNVSTIVYNGGSATPVMLIHANGNVNIGSSLTDPGVMLEVQKANSSALTVNSNTVIHAENSGEAWITVSGGSANAKGILFANSSANGDGAIVYDSPAVGARSLQFNTANAGRLKIDSSGNTTLNVGSAGTTTILGNVIVGSSVVTMNATSGNTLVAGTLDSTGDFKVNTNKFTVTASSGNTLVAGTLDVTGTTSLNGDATICDGSGDTLKFYGGTGATQQTVTGSRADPEQALKDVLAKLATLGIVLDGTTA